MKFCSQCGKEILDQANICPHCGCSVVNGSSKKVHKNRKPGCLIIFVIIFVLFIAFFTAILFSDDGTTTTSDETTITEISENKQELKTYKVGETVTFKTDRGDYSLKFTGIKETFERNDLADEKPERVIILEYEYKNISFDSDVVVSYLYFRAYDKDGNALTIYPDTSVKYTTNISQGKTATASVAYGLDNDENCITVDFYDITMESMHKPECTFNLTW